MHGQSSAPIGLHKTDAASDWLVQKARRSWGGSSVRKLIGLHELSA